MAYQGFARMTENCIICAKPATVMSGHVHKKVPPLNRIVKVFAAICESCAAKGPRYFRPTYPSCIGCRGDWRKEDGFKEVNAAVDKRIYKSKKPKVGKRETFSIETIYSKIDKGWHIEIWCRETAETIHTTDVYPTKAGAEEAAEQWLTGVSSVVSRDTCKCGGEVVNVLTQEQ